jgi:hypothetical protein
MYVCFFYRHLGEEHVVYVSFYFIFLVVLLGRIPIIVNVRVPLFNLNN